MDLVLNNLQKTIKLNQPFSAITSLRVHQMSLWVCLVEAATEREPAGKLRDLVSTNASYQRPKKNGPSSRSIKSLMRKNFSLKLLFLDMH